MPGLFPDILALLPEHIWYSVPISAAICYPDALWAVLMAAAGEPSRMERRRVGTRGSPARRTVAVIREPEAWSGAVCSVCFRFIENLRPDKL
jgi:hypothetical protein